MFNVSRRTYKNLVDEVLSWTGDAEDEGSMRELAQYAVTAAHEKRLTNNRLSFMLWPKIQTFTTVAGQKAYSLHEAFGSPLWFFNQTANRPVKDTPPAMEDHFLPGSYDPRQSMHYIKLQGVAKVKNQPSAASTLTATSSAPADNGKTVIVVGETSAGMVEETLTLPNAGSTSFLPGGILDVVKVGTGWTGTLTLTASDGTVVLTLAASQYGRQFKQLVAHNDQRGGETINYQFYRQPKPLRYDNDIPDLPYPYDRLLVLDSLLKLAGFTRATAVEIKGWQLEAMELEQNMLAEYSEAQSVFSEVNYQKFVER